MNNKTSLFLGLCTALAISLIIIINCLLQLKKDFFYPAQLATIPLTSLYTASFLLAFIASLSAILMCRKNSPLASPITIKGSGKQVLREYGNYILPIVLLVPLSSVASIYYVYASATGGKVLWQWLFAATVTLLFITSLSYLIGVLVNGWRGVFYAVFIIAIIEFSFPYLVFMIGGYTEIPYLAGEKIGSVVLFELIPSHIPLVHNFSLAWWGIYILELVVTIGIIVLLWATQRNFAKLGKTPFFITGVAVLLGLVAMCVWTTKNIALADEYVNDNIFCKSGTKNFQVCVTAEEKPAIDRLLAVGEKVLGRVPGDHSDVLIKSSLAQIDTKGKKVVPVTVIGTDDGAKQMSFEIAADYSGLNKCVENDISFALSLTYWLANNPEDNKLGINGDFGEDDFETKLWKMRVEEVKSFYIKNKTDILECKPLTLP